MTGLAPSAQASLITSRGKTLATQKADSLGGLLFRNVPPGSGYRVRPELGRERVGAAHGAQRCGRALGSEHLQPDDLGQRLPVPHHPRRDEARHRRASADDPAGEPGLPAGTPLPNGPTDYLPPYPTLIEYSGYGYADPAGPENGIAVLANLMGFAVVDVNMRGTGCSGGAFNFFEPLQNLDGYDVIETIAHQPWVLGHKVGMMGISYGAISQLFTAQLDPPDLEAISPLSTIDATASTLYPGGILNTGFAVAWAEQRQEDAEPAGPDSGQPWAYQQIQNGDTTCAANQVLHGEAANLHVRDRRQLVLQPGSREPVGPGHLRQQDQGAGVHGLPMGGRADGWALPGAGPALHRDDQEVVHLHQRRPHRLARSGHLRPVVRLPRTVRRPPGAHRERGGHPRRRAGHLPGGHGAPGYRSDHPAPRPDPGDPDVQRRARRLREASRGPGALRQRRRVLAHRDLECGRSLPRLRDRTSRRSPFPGTTAQTWYLGPDGTLADQPPASEGINWYTSNASALPLTDFGSNTGSGGLWGNASQWQWNWEQNPAGSAVSYVSAPLATNTTVIGGGAVYVWVRSSTPDVDLQATVSEVRPDGNETFVQNGWIRASERKLSTGSDNEFDTPSTIARPDPQLHEGRRGAHAGRQVRRRSPFRCTTRGTSTVRDRAFV